MENNLIKWIVYCTTNTVNNKIYIGVHRTNPNEFDGYIGCGCYIHSPKSYQNGTTNLQRAIQQFGPDKFKRRTIKIFDSSKEAYDYEAEIVNKTFLKRPDVYNMIPGGFGGDPDFEPTMLYQYDSEGNYITFHISIQQAARNIERAFATLYRAYTNKYKCANCYFTDCKIDKLDLSTMHQYKGLHNKIIYQYDLNGNYERCYNTSREAAKILGINNANISNSAKIEAICKDKYLSYKKYDKMPIVKKPRKQGYKLYQYDLNGNFIQEFDGMPIAKKTLGIKSDLYKAAKRGITAGGFQWSLEKVDKMKIITNTSGRSRRVGKYDMDSNLIKVYNSMSECERENGRGVHHVLYGRDKTAKGFQYKFLD